MLKLGNVDISGIKDTPQQILFYLSEKEYPESIETVYTLLSSGRTALRLFRLDQDTNSFLSQARRLLDEAYAIAERIDDRRTKSLARGYQSEVYAAARRYVEAKELLQEAIFLAQGEPALLLQWYRQKGHLFKRENDIDRAIKMYRRAVANLEIVRQNIRKDGFEETIKSLYLELADLLLRRAETRTDDVEKECPPLPEAPISRCQKKWRKKALARAKERCESPLRSAKTKKTGKACDLECGHPCRLPNRRLSGFIPGFPRSRE
ncbi:MAG: tetratricopeptide repeat protein [Gammaproteobacteria bacterium]|nr:tetratricopeptide repeat protein [Gammaproteobacteria bacterium]